MRINGMIKWMGSRLLQAKEKTSHKRGRVLCFGGEKKGDWGDVRNI